ncbi:MAG TPA: DUF6763 family protein [Gammaproteobacteria bacterium]|nr:DUF6763 family protein [Gammaproteobacteria bacterium]
MTEPEPARPVLVGEWYGDASGASLEVVAVDEEDGTIEVQYFDGTVAEYDAETWQEMRLHEIDPPEDWSGSFDIEREDYGVELDEERRPEMWANPLDQLEL